MSLAYERFLIHVSDQEGDDYPVLAHLSGEKNSGSWSGKIPVDLPLLTTDEKQKLHFWLEKGFIDHDYQKDFGDRLFQTLFAGEILKGYRESVDRATSERGLRIVLILPPGLSSFPWEFIYDRTGSRGFLARSAITPLTRHISGVSTSVEMPKGGTALADPVKILVVMASPKGYSPVSYEEETKGIIQSLRSRPTSIREIGPTWGRQLSYTRSIGLMVERLRRRSLFEIDVLEKATRQGLQTRLNQAQNEGRGFEIIHFVGHGDIDDRGGLLLFETESGEPDLVLADEFAEIVGDPRGIKLVFLNACNTAAPARLFQNVAEATLGKGIPAVIGMQVPILDRTAVEFAKEFYGYWANGEPIESALALARRMIIGTTKGGEARTAVSEWGIPVLYMAPLDGVNIRKPRPPAPLRHRFVKVFSYVFTFLIPLAITYYQFILPYVQARSIHMDRRFNIAFADFGTVTDYENGRVQATKDGKELSDYAFSEFQKQLATNPTLKDIVGLKGDNVGLIRGNTPEARQFQAAKRAEEINADILIYGNIDDSRSPFQFVPEFYISPRLAGAEEATGSSAFGAPFEVSLPLTLTDHKAKLSKDFIPRINMLAEFMWGLAYYKADVPDLALMQLNGVRQKLEAQQALETQQGLQEGQRIDQGGDARAVLYLWIGATLIEGDFQGIGEQHSVCPVQGAEEAEGWECANAAYDKALELQNHQFARAYIGLGNLRQSLARRSHFGQVTVECSMYDLAEGEYRKALDKSVKAKAIETAYIDLKVFYNTGTAFASAYRYGCGDDYYPRAVKELESALQAFEDDPEAPIAQEIGAKAAYQLGVIHRRANHLDDALNEFEHAMKISKIKNENDLLNNEWKVLYWNAQIQKGYTHNLSAEMGYVKERQAALEAFNNVVTDPLHKKYSAPIVLSDAYFGLGLVYNQTGQPEKAIEPLESSIANAAAMNTGNARPIETLPWRAYLELGKAKAALAPAKGAKLFKEALDAYQKIIEQYKSGSGTVDGQTASDAYYQKGLIYQELGEVDQARASFEAVLEIVDADPVIIQATREKLTHLGQP